VSGWRSEGEPGSDVHAASRTTASFADVPFSSPFAPWIQELMARAITAGCATGFYCPSEPVTRAQMAVFLTKTLA
jgi:hypothetical protein